jgi:RNA polymerase sigma-70 factor (ECF subfamily)
MTAACKVTRKSTLPCRTHQADGGSNKMSSTPARYFPGIFARRNGNGAHGHDSAYIHSLAGSSELPAARDSEITDETLILRLQKKDVEALGLLYRRHARLVYSVCDRILRDSAEAEDLVHEVFLCLYRKCRSFDPGRGGARSWLLQLTYHKCFDWRDYLRARHGYGQGNGDTNSPVALPERIDGRDPADQIIWNPRMKAAFETLSKEQQLTLNLYYFEGYTFQEIGKHLGYSYGNVKHHVYRGIEHLRRIVFDRVADRTSPETSQGMTCESKEVVG